MKKILIVEDDLVLSRELKIMLENNGFEACVLSSFGRIKEDILHNAPDLVLLDIMLPGTSGQAVLKELRKVSDLPVIMLTSRDTEIDEVLSMSYGADDYVTKPYNPTLLLLHIDALFKRMEKKIGALVYRDVTINLLKSTLETDNKELLLSKNEMAIFYYLVSNQGRIVSRDELMDYLWDTNKFIDDNTLTVNINRLRKRLEEIGLHGAVETRRGQGYLLR